MAEIRCEELGQNWRFSAVNGMNHSMPALAIMLGEM